MSSNQDFCYYALFALLCALIDRGHTHERAVALLEAGRWP